MRDIILKRVKFETIFCEGIFIMEELIALSSDLHLLFIVLLVGLIGGNLYLLKSDRSFVSLSKRLELLAPQYYIVLAAIFFTGLIVMAVRQFTFSPLVWVMIGVWVYIVAFGIRNHKSYKKVRIAQMDLNRYKTLTIRKYLIDALLIVITSLLFYTVR